MQVTIQHEMYTYRWTRFPGLGNTCIQCEMNSNSHSIYININDIEDK